MEVTEDYRRNLDVLQKHQASCAKLIADSPIPEFVISVTGRDGQPTYQFQSANTENAPSIWLGGSSMPSISAPELIHGFVSDGGSTVLPGIFTGLEPILLLERMPRHAAVFVIEPDPLLLKLALCLYDYRPFIKTGRLVFITADDESIDREMLRFFENHPGYQMVKHLQAIPITPLARIALLQRKLESISSLVQSHQTKKVEQQLKIMQQQRRELLPDAPRVALLSFDARPEAMQLGRALDRALSNLNWPHELFIPDSPGKCHVVAGLETIVKIKADVVITYNSSLSSLSQTWPGQLPLMEWYLPNASLANTPGTNSHPSLYRFASTKPIQSTLNQLSKTSSETIICPVAADDTTYYPLDTTGQLQEPDPLKIAILADLPDDRPESCGLNLLSHAELWQAALHLVDENPNRFLVDDPDLLLTEAETVSGTSLQDEPVRKHFHQLIQTILTPAAMGRACVRSLTSANHPVAVWGRGWNFTVQRERQLHQGEIPTGEALNRLFQTAQVVVFPSRSLTVPQRALNALLTGRPVLMYKPAVELDELFPGMEEIYDFLPIYQTTRELVQRVDEFVADPAHTDKLMEQARSGLLEKHTLQARLRSMVECARQRGARTCGVCDTSGGRY